jgi:hypothetical protein
MAITFFWRCEGTTFDGTHDYSAGDSTPTSLGTPSIAAGAAKVGSNGISCPVSATSHYSFDIGSISGMVGSAGYWFKTVSAYPAAGAVCGFQIVGATTTNLLNVQASGTDELTFRNAQAGGSGSSLTTSGANLAPDTWYGVIVRWDFTVPSSSSKKLEVYDSSGNLLAGMPTELSGTNLASSAPIELTTVQCGRHSSTSAVVQYADNFVISDAYDEVTAAMLAYDSYTDFSSVVTYLKLLADASAASAASVQGVVLNATRDTVIGEFSGQAFEAALESGEAVLLIPLADITPDGTTLTTSDTPLVSAYNATDGTVGLGSATVVEI